MRWLARLWNALRDAAMAVVRPVWRFLARGAQAIRAAVGGFVRDVRDRHRHRIEVDPSYPVALASGSTAAAGVLSASPAVAAAIGVLVAQALGVSARSQPTRPRSTPWGRNWSEPDSDWDDGRTRLWERTDWDDE